MAMFEYDDQILKVDDATFHVLIRLTNRLHDVETSLGELAATGVLAPTPDDTGETWDAKQKASRHLGQAKARQR